ncbi:MAG: hypothetical protein II371_05975 [Flavobacteriales bacterium]|nr:hypothetical protein [Flavobacteriales bacterium]
MKRKKLFLATIVTLIGSMSCMLMAGTQKTTPAGDKKVNVETAYRAAKKAFYDAPQDKTAEEKYIAATKALWSSQDARAAEMKKTRENASAEQKAHWEAEKKLNAALKAWREDVNSQEKQKAAIEAQKAAFAAQRAAAPIFVLGDKIIEDMSKIDFSKMGKGSYLCSEEAVKKYGDKARNGAIILKYKTVAPATKVMPGAEGGHRPPQQGMTSPTDRTSQMLKAAGATAAEEKKAREIFAKYNPQIWALRKDNNALLRGKDGRYDVNKVLENNVAIEKKRAEMYGELSKIFSAEQLNKLYRSEMEMARNMVQGRPMQMGSNPQHNKPNTKPTRQ